MKFLTWQQLHDRGILPSRQHTRRLIARGIIPKPYRLGDPERGRLMWLESDIENYIARKLAERDAPRPRLAAGDNVVSLRRRDGSRLKSTGNPPLNITPGSPVDAPLPRMILRRPER
jgi:predicted DNA-binding transcriptional regulator AlpA